VVILQDGGERGAVRRAVRMQVINALGEVEVTAVSVQQIAYASMRGSFQAAEQTGVPIEIVGGGSFGGGLGSREGEGRQGDIARAGGHMRGYRGRGGICRNAEGESLGGG
jgi:hypothetical protein